jgi:nucleoid-associated protein YgaU
MALQEKYQSAVNFLNQLGAQNVRVEEADGVLKVWAQVADNYEKDQVWDSIKAIGGDGPTDIVADIQPANADFYTKYTVEKGDSLSKIAKLFYGDMAEYPKIFNANRDVLDDPNVVQIGQVLTIPNP